MTSSIQTKEQAQAINETRVINALTWDTSTGKLLCTNEAGRRIDITYATKGTLRAKHLLAVVRAIHRDDLAWNSRTQTVLHNGRGVSTADLRGLCLKVCDKHGINLPEKDYITAVQEIAKEKPRDPFTQELLEIEGNATIEAVDVTNLSTRYLGTNDQLYNAMLEKWLVAFVGRQLQPGLYYRTMLVLVGKQGVGKDAMAKIIAGGDEHVGRAKAQLNAPDNLRTFHSSRIILFDELEQTTQRVITGELKSWLAETSDKIVPKYSNDCEDKPRQFGYWGSCNQQDFLEDRTGNTRFHCIPVPFDTNKGSMIDLERLKHERPGILKGALALFRKHQRGEYSLDLPLNLRVRSEQQNSSYITGSAFGEKLAVALHERTTTCLGEAQQMLELSNHSWSQKSIQKAVKDSLQELGFNQWKQPSKLIAWGEDRKARRQSVRCWVRGNGKPNTDELEGGYLQPDYSCDDEEAF
ncbi:VapE domain-containing protein [Synechococcus sp. CBW1107]|uniref:VapE domain-containing protein n=1 Tax=Synechococcus sp. CBW1107 TaxID=2789857 RepID=UPI002AD2864A|nr:VapE domain-containing protein [Synechococcus sp. CBW1107]CAK6687373.1 hypothetical protein ICNINCKA_00190 [Synechococcus sp. CBW1107]